MLALAREFLGRKELPEARLEAELLVAHALGIDRLKLFMGLDRPVTSAEVDAARATLVRRAKREPVAHLTGEREFYGRPFAVDARVLVPRPETELLCDLARDCCKAFEHAPRIADVGTGSGCIAITLALEVEQAVVRAVDLSPEALEVARSNAEALGATVEFVLGDGPEALGPGPFDLLVSNPPYIGLSERDSLAPEVRDYEPELALFLPAGDPEHWLRRLLEAGLARLAAGGILLVELGAGQSELALRLASEYGLEASVHEDLARIPRVLEVRAPSS